MAKENGEKPVVEFDLDAMTADDLGYFRGGVTGPEHIQLMAEGLVRIITKCPSEWGPKDDPQTFRKLSWRKVWKTIIFPSLTEALKNGESE